MRIVGVRIYQLYAPLFFTLICQEGIKGKMKFDTFVKKQRAERKRKKKETQEVNNVFQ